jgi:ABC-type Zn2+ transport system substrate-binding protein/surface adhesin
LSFFFEASDIVKQRFKFFFVFLLIVGPAKQILSTYSSEYVQETSHKLEINNANQSIIAHANQTTHEEHDHDHHDSDEKHNDDHKHHENAILNFFVLNADPLLSMSLSIIYLFFFFFNLKEAGKILSQALPSSLVDIDSDKIEEELKNRVK